jgi:hypothetical protein
MNQMKECYYDFHHVQQPLQQELHLVKQVRQRQLALELLLDKQAQNQH